MEMNKYKCPHCGFPVYNRRVKRCESCHAPLPAEMLYSKEQAEEIDAQFEKNKAQVDRLRRDMGVNGGGGSSGDSGFGDGGFGDCGGDGGGGCD